jgi:uncharacterized protein YgiM (DUF1202 family)
MSVGDNKESTGLINNDDRNSSENLTGVDPLQVEECGSTSSKTCQNNNHETSRTVSRQKRKMRYLTELLADEGNLSNDVPRQEDYSKSKLAESSDDIPKDIFEFMAQLQYQWGIGNAGNTK